MNRMKTPGILVCAALISLFAAGCSQQSYQAGKLKEAVAGICQKEYGISNVDAKVVGKTLGVFLPLDQLFARDFKEALTSGKVDNVENLFQPSEEAMNKVEDVLFTISRVVLSTDQPLDFYILKAADVDNTGLELVLEGTVEDVKRVRIWDISRDEYRKRVVHELRLNPALLWHKPVRQFFRELTAMPSESIQKKYFRGLMGEETFEKFLSAFGVTVRDLQGLKADILDVRSTAFEDNGAVVYAKVRLNKTSGTAESGGMTYEFLFMMGGTSDHPQILKIIPFQYRDETGSLKKIEFPEELAIEDNLSEWDQEFDVKDMTLGPFLAEQITRRVQGMMSVDERVHNTVRQGSVKFSYHEETVPPHFSLEMDILLRDQLPPAKGQSQVYHDDMLYILNLISKEFVNVLRSYRFGDYAYLELDLAQDPVPVILKREDLDLFRRNKIDMQGLLSSPVNL